MDSLENIRAPLQERSRRTLDRILNATEALLQKAPFEALSIRDIVRRARTSTGSFYARFPAKEALLPALYARYEERLDQDLSRLRAEVEDPKRTLRQVSEAIVGYFVQTFEARRHLMRALALHVRASPEQIDSASRQRRQEQHAFLEEALQVRLKGHPSAKRASELAIFFAASACRERIVFHASTHAASLRSSPGEFVSDVVTMMMGYLLYPMHEES